MNSVRLAAHSKLCKGVNTYLSLCVNRLVTFSLYGTLGELQHLPPWAEEDGWIQGMCFFQEIVPQIVAPEKIYGYPTGFLPWEISQQSTLGTHL